MGRAGRAIAFLKKEFVEMLPPTIFFFVVFHIVVLVRDLLGERAGIAMTTSAAATLAALVVGKSILVADALPLFKMFRSSGLLYDILWRVFLFLCIVLLFQGLEELVPLVSKHGGLAAALGHSIEEIDWRRFWATHIALGVFLTFYAFATAVIDQMGRREFVDALLGRGRTPGSGTGTA